MERKWTDIEYHVQDNDDVEHQDVRMCLNKNNSPEFSFCGPYSKPHGTRGSSKHYNLRFDSKIGMGICEISHIPCACVTCASTMDKPWISGISSYEYKRYKPVNKCTYCPLLGSFKNWNNIK